MLLKALSGVGCGSRPNLSLKRRQREKNSEESQGEKWEDPVKTDHQKGINEMPPSALYMFVPITLIHP